MYYLIINNSNISMQIKHLLKVSNSYSIFRLNNKKEIFEYKVILDPCGVLIDKSKYMKERWKKVNNVNIEKHGFTIESLRLHIENNYPNNDIFGNAYTSREAYNLVYMYNLLNN